MKPLLLALAFSATLAAQPSSAPPRIVSPEIAPDRHVTFRIAAPKADEVLLTGEFMRGSKSFEKDDRGVWSITIGPLEPEIYHYNVIIDGIRSIDPGNAFVKTGSTPSTLQSILEVRGDAPAFYDGKPVPHGEVRTHWYHSKSLGTLRRLTIYVPPGYDADANRSTRYPVLYLFHGANADETAWVKLGRANLILDNLLAENKTRPCLVVMPFGYGVEPGGSSAPGQNTARFSQDLLDDVLPYVDAHYRTLPDREHRAIVGLSMGGGQALSIGLNHLDQFAYVGGFSSGLGRSADFPQIYARLIASPEESNQRLRLLWVGCGVDDGAFTASKTFSEFLTQHRIKHTFRETSGAHTWIVWRRYLLEVAPLLFR